MPGPARAEGSTGRAGPQRRRIPVRYGPPDSDGHASSVQIRAPGPPSLPVSFRPRRCRRRWGQQADPSPSQGASFTPRRDPESGALPPTSSRTQRRQLSSSRKRLGLGDLPALTAAGRSLPRSARELESESLRRPRLGQTAGLRAKGFRDQPGAAERRCWCRGGGGGGAGPG